MAGKSKKDRDNFEKLKREMTNKRKRASRQIVEDKTEEQLHENVSDMLSGYNCDVKDNSSDGFNKKENAKISGKNLDLIVFKSNGIEYALPVSKVKEIIRIPNLIKPPNAQEVIKGMCNLRGKLLPVIDTGLLFDGYSQKTGDLSRIIVLENDGLMAGLISDTVSEVIAVSKENIKEAPANIRGKAEKYIGGIIISDKGRRVIILLNMESILKLGNPGTAKEPQPLKSSVPEKSNLQETEQIILFGIGDGDYGINIEYVKEVMRIPKLTRSPYAPDCIEGVFSFRDNIIPLINTGKLLNLSSGQLKESGRVIVLGYENVTFGILVDKVSRIISVQKESITSDNQISNNCRSEYIRNFLSLDNGDKVVMVLALHKLIDFSEYGSGLFGHIEERIVKSESSISESSNYEAEEDGAFVHIIIFKLDNLEYGIDIGKVREIGRIRGISRLPKAPYFIDGIVDLRGEIIPIMNLRKLFGLQNIYTYSDEKIIVVEHENKKIGFLTDQVSEIVKIPVYNVEDAPETDGGNTGKNYIQKIAKLNNNMRTVMMLNLTVLSECLLG